MTLCNANTYAKSGGVSFQLLGMLKPGDGHAKQGTVMLARLLGKVTP